MKYPGFTKEDTLGVLEGGLLDNEHGYLSGGNGPNGWNSPYYTSGVTTHFSDHNDGTDPDSLNDSGVLGELNANRHWSHLGVPSDYRGTGSVVFGSCVNCHDVHGSNTIYGAVYDEMGYTNAAGAWGTYGKLPDEVFLPAADPNFLDLDLYPTYCEFNCHNASGDGAYLDVNGPNKAWFDLIQE